MIFEMRNNFSRKKKFITEMRAIQTKMEGINAMKE